MKMIQCDICKEEFQLNAVEIKKSEILLNDEKLQLTHFECPKCGQLFRICLDNEETLRLITECKSLVIICERQMKVGKIPSNSISKRIEILKKRIDALQRILDKKYSGSFTITDNK